MKLDPQDPRLMDYVLNELPLEEAEKIRAALELPENADAHVEVEDLRVLTGKLSTVLQSELQTQSLDELSKERIIRSVANPENQSSERIKDHKRSERSEFMFRWVRVTAVAALVLVVAGIIIMPVFSPAREAARRSSPESEARVREYLALQGAGSPIGESAGHDLGEQLRSLGYFSDSFTRQRTRLGVGADFTDEVSRRIAQDAQYGYVTDEFGVIRKRGLGTESYADINDNPYSRALDTPLSTFSIDVDTASYSNVRRFLDAGHWPPADAVRIEELVNYFDYEYAPPNDSKPFAAHVEVAECPWNTAHYIARIGLKGFEVPVTERPNGNYVFLVDVSGSMNRANKLPLVQESLKTLLNQLGSQDRVGIVTYASGSAIHLPSTSCKDKKKIVKAIEALVSSGSTHGSAGIRDAYAMARANFIEGGINRVILATDGDFNVGLTSHNELHELIANEAKSNVFLTALGYGMGNYKDDTLELLADKGNGNYAYIDSYREVRRTLVQKLTSTLMTIAKDVKIQVEFNPAKVASYRLIGYENRMLAARDFNDDTKDAGEIGAGHSVTALYEIVPVGAMPQPGVDPLRYQETPPPAPTEAKHGEEWFLLKLRYKEPEGDTSALMEIPVAQPPVSIESASADTRFAAGVAAFGMVLRNSPHKGLATLDMAQELAASALNNDETRQEFLDMIVTAKTLTKN